MNEFFKVNANFLFKFATLNKFQQTMLIQSIQKYLDTTETPTLSKNILELYQEVKKANEAQNEKE